SWQAMLRARKQMSKQDCLVPEVSRVAFASFQCDGAGVRGQCGPEEVLARSLAPRSVFAAVAAADLGDVRRLTAERYPDLLLRSWPGGQ
ncbi:POMGNT1, partial [Symbiodinium sp. CCMP2456]